MESNSQFGKDTSVSLSRITKTLDDTKSNPLSPELINKIQKDDYLRIRHHLARLEQKNVDNLTNAQIEAMSESQVKTLSHMMSPAQKALIQKAPYGINTDGSLTTKVQFDATTAAAVSSSNKAGIYAGIGIGSLFGLLILIYVGYIIYQKKKQSKMVSQAFSGFGRKISRFGNDLRQLR
jgi:hypothetical protein